MVPDPLRDYLTTAPVYVSKSGAPVPAQPDLPSTIRRAIRATRKMRIAYQDGDGRNTERVIQPFAVAYYTGATLICAWCELRKTSDIFAPTGWSALMCSTSHSQSLRP